MKHCTRAQNVYHTMAAGRCRAAPICKGFDSRTVWHGHGLIGLNAWSCRHASQGLINLLFAGVWPLLGGGGGGNPLQYSLARLTYPLSLTIYTFYVIYGLIQHWSESVSYLVNPCRPLDKQYLFRSTRNMHKRGSPSKRMRNAGIGSQ